MPLKPLTATIILCEKILNETDGMVSAIRIADAFFVPPLIPGVSAESHAVLMHVLVRCQFEPDDISKHSIALRLRRPDGTEKDVDFGMPLEASLADLEPKVAGATRGINIIAPWGVKATHMGLHRVAVFVDGEEVAFTIFTLAPLPAQAKE